MQIAQNLRACCLQCTVYSAYIRLKYKKVILIVALWSEFRGKDFNSSLCSMDVSFSGAEYLKICLNLAIVNV